MDSNLIRRIAFAAVAIPLAVGLTWLGGWPLAVLVSLIAVLGVRELYDLAFRQQIEAFRGLGLTLAAFIPLAVQAFLVIPRARLFLIDWWPALGTVVVLALLAAALLSRAADRRPLTAIAVTAFGVIYAAALPAFLLTIRSSVWPSQSWAGVALVFFPLVVTWICDTAAMFGGRAFGGPKLAPTISPGKTRSGGIAGLVGGVAVAPLFALLIFPAVGIELSLAAAVLIALALAIVGQLGDLAESLLKREAGVKDSSSLIPGHGGVLDRFDSLYVVLPVAAICYSLVGLL